MYYGDGIDGAGTNRLASVRNTAGWAVMGIAYDAPGNLRNKNDQTYEFDTDNPAWRDHKGIRPLRRTGPHTDREKMTRQKKPGNFWATLRLEETQHALQAQALSGAYPPLHALPKEDRPA